MRDVVNLYSVVLKLFLLKESLIQFMHQKIFHVIFFTGQKLNRIIKYLLIVNARIC